MHRLGMFLLLLVLGASTHSYAQEATPSLTPLKEWVGKFPLDPNKKFFWDDPLLQDAARKALDKEHFDGLFNGLAKQVITPVEQKGDVLFAFACKEHACNTDNANLYVNLKTNTISVCWTSSTDPKDVWFSTGKKPKVLADSGCSLADGVELYYMNEKD